MATEPSESTAHPGLLPCSLHETSSTYVTVPSGLTDKLTYQDCLQYYLYGAMVYMMGKHWEAALGFLETILEWPANAVSMIQVKAYEKWVLVGLLQNGKVSALKLDHHGLFWSYNTLILCTATGNTQ